MKALDTTNTFEETLPPTAVATDQTRTRPRVVIVGAGFGGLNAAKELAKAEVDVLMLDRNNYHGFWPLLYQVATAGLGADSIAYPVRAILRKYPNVGFEVAEVQSIDFEHKQILADQNLKIDYDYLILAAGSANNYFGNHKLETETFGLKDVNEALQLRNHILENFEKAIREADPEKRRKLMTLVIIGGGPTGTELSGAFAELIRHVLKKDYPMLDVNMARVILIEGGKHLLAAFSEVSGQRAIKKLEKLGVEVHLDSMVDTVENGVVTYKRKHGDNMEQMRQEAATVVWAAGVRASTLSDKLGLKLAKGGRVPVQPTLNLAEHPEVFIVGDMAYLEGYHGGAYPMVAQPAIQQGHLAAKNLLAGLQGQPMKPFHYFDKGTMATIGRQSAVLEMGWLKLGGFLAWLGWLFIHILYLSGFRNRLIVLTNWAYNYFTYDRGARLIIGDRTKGPPR